MPIITNPLGLLALLGIPAILAIHYLQRRAKIVPCSTLFLLQQTQKKSSKGGRWDKLLPTLALWMQLLIVLLLTLLLIEPRYLKENSTQRIALVLDSSASMSVFKNQTKEKIATLIPTLQGKAPHMELWILDSDLRKKRLYHGSNTQQALESLKKWQPQSGTTSPHHAMRVARSLVGKNGALAYVTDTPQEKLPYEPSIHAIGTPQNNVGFTGIEIEQKNGTNYWKASLKNYSKTAVERTWHIRAANNTRSKNHALQLAPRELKLLHGKFPKAQNSETPQKIELRLNPDAFTGDDTLPLLIPQEKQLYLEFQLDQQHQFLQQKITQSFANIKPITSKEKADLLCLSLPEKNKKNKLPNRPALIFLSNEQKRKNYKIGKITATQHPLNEGLNWQNLLTSPIQALKPHKRDEVLLFLDKQPLIYLRNLPQGFGKNRQQLIFNFDINNANALQQEATALLLYRYLQQQKKQKHSLQQQMTELNQPLEIKHQEDSPLKITQTDLNNNILHTSSHAPNSTLHSPNQIGFYNISQEVTSSAENQTIKNKTLFYGANFFADTREADLSQCDTATTPQKNEQQAENQHTQQDHFWQVWLLLVLLAFLISWHQPKTTI